MHSGEKVRSGDTIRNPRLGPNLSRKMSALYIAWRTGVHQLQKDSSGLAYVRPISAGNECIIAWQTGVHQLQKDVSGLAHVRPHQPPTLGSDMPRKIAQLPSRERQSAPINYKNRRFLLEFMYGRITHSFSASTCGKDLNKSVRFLTPLFQRTAAHGNGVRVWRMGRGDSYCIATRLADAR